tara:strand:- start:68 stop:670 length:603 start_codon:yes stop_codon:yes gene_type:complete
MALLTDLLSDNTTAISDNTTAIAETGGAWTLLSTITASGSSKVTFDSGIDSTYNRYVIIGSGIYGSSSAGFGAQLKIGGSWQSSGHYYQHIRQVIGSTGSSSYDSGVGNSGADRANNLTGNDVQTSASLPANITLQIDTPSANAYHAIKYDGVTLVNNTAARKSVGGTISHSTQGVLTGIRFLLFYTNMYGSFSLYGINK